MGGFGGTLGDVVDDVERTVSNLGHDVSGGIGQAYRGAIRHILGSGRSGFGLVAKNFGITPGRLGAGRPKVTIPKTRPHPLIPILQAEELTNAISRSAQPWSYSGSVTIPVGTVFAAGATVFDMFTTANTPQFATNYQFKNPFQASRLRMALQTAPAQGAADDAAWRNSLQLSWTIETEIARSSLASYCPQVVLADGTGTHQLDEHLGVVFTPYFEKNSSYQPQIIAPIGATTTSALRISYVLDGWTVQGGTDTDEGEVKRQVANLIGAPVDEALDALRMHLSAAGMPVLF